MWNCTEILIDIILKTIIIGIEVSIMLKPMLPYLFIVLLVLIFTPMLSAQNSNIELAGTILPNIGTPTNYIRVDEYAYLVGGLHSLCVLNISNIQSPQFIGFYDYGPDILTSDIKRAGNYLYVAHASYYLSIVDISDPEAPTFERYVSFNGIFKDIWMDDSRLLVLDNNHNIKSYDIVNPSLPVFMGDLSIGVSSYDLEVIGSTLFSSDGSSLLVIDIIDLSNMQLTATIVDLPYHYVVGTQGNILVCQFFATVYLYNAVNPSSLTLISSYLTPGNYANRIRTGNGYIVANWYEEYGMYDSGGGIQIVDVTDPTNPTQTYISGATNANVTFALSEDTLCRIVPNVGVFFGELNEFMIPEFGGWFYTERFTLHASTNDKLFVANSKGIRIYSTSDLLHPAPIGWIGEISAFLMETKDDILVVVTTFTDHDGLYTPPTIRIYNTIDTTNPVLLASLATPYGVNWGGSPSEVRIAGNYIYLSCSSTGLLIIDISDPTTPFEVSRINNNVSIYSSVAENDYLYCAAYEWTGQSFLRIYDISQPQNPELFSEIPIPNSIKTLDKQDSYIYAVGSSNLLYTYNVVDLDTPTLAYTMELGSSGKQVICNGNRLIVLGEQNLKVFNINDPVNPQLAGYYTFNQNIAYSVAISSNIAYVKQSNWTGCYDCSAAYQFCGVNEEVTPVNVVRIDNYPNPFNSTTSFFISDTKLAGTQLHIYNLKGQKVNSLTIPSSAKDEIEMIWDGRDFDKRPCSAGVYLVKAATVPFSLKKITIMK